VSKPRWMQDTIIRRFALAFAAAVAVAFALNAAFILLGGNLARPSAEEMGLPDQVATITRMIDAAPPDARMAMTRAVKLEAFTVTYRGANSALTPKLGTDVQAGQAIDDLRDVLGDWTGAIRFYKARDLAALPGDLGAEAAAHPDSAYLEVALHDGTWLVFSASPRVWGPSPAIRYTLRLVMLLVSIALVSLVGAGQLARPINAFAQAARRFGSDPNARPMKVKGPYEIRLAMLAFNDMQLRIQRSMSGQAAVFSAISHDLRSPLTRMRLRGEFIQDPRQQERLFRDIDEMQAMVGSALAFLRDNAAEEETTSLNLPELLRTIADDFADLGTDVAYDGPDQLAFPGRPVGLRRAFGNLVDNAARYGTNPAITLRTEAGEVVITISDDGPGIPEDALEEVFAPFQRLDPSRNRQTGGIGLGLTAARAAFRAHGGDVTLTNKAGGGLQAIIRLPMEMTH
jgi:signal transduction histidine kinase